MTPVPVLYQDPFSPKLFSSEVLTVSPEQKLYVRKVLDICSSDSRFAEKAYVAISQILTGGSVKVPTVTSLVPSSVVVGEPSFTLHVHGTNFTETTKIIFNGGEEVTVFVADHELTTEVNMSTVSGPVTVPVGVMSEDGVMSNTMDFTFAEMNDGTPLMGRALGSSKTVSPKEKK